MTCSRSYRALGIGALLIWAAVALGACESPHVPRGRVLLVGIDGATLRIARPLLEQGKLPHLAKIARAGVSGPLRSVMPLLSPPIWATIATGKSRQKHGILSFVRNDKEGKRRLYLSSDRKAHALWNIASDADLTVGIINWWTTYPVERINGIMVSDHALPGQAERRHQFFRATTAAHGPTVFPPEWEKTLWTTMTQTKTLTDFSDPFLGNSGVAPWMNPKGMSLSYRRDTLITNIALKVESTIHPDILMVFLPGIDRVSHGLWANIEPSEMYPPNLRPSPSQRAAGASALRHYYEYTDALIGILAERFGPEDLIMVVSDHGFEAGVNMMTVTGQHKTKKARDGVILARGHGIAAGKAAGAITVNDITPTILSWIGLAVADDMDGAPASFLGRLRPKRIATYDTSVIERLNTKQASGAEDSIIEELRSLGYIQ